MLSFCTIDQKPLDCWSAPLNIITLEGRMLQKSNFRCMYCIDKMMWSIWILDQNSLDTWSKPTWHLIFFWILEVKTTWSKDLDYWWKMFWDDRTDRVGLRLVLRSVRSMAFSIKWTFTNLLGRISPFPLFLFFWNFNLSLKFCSF